MLYPEQVIPFLQHDDPIVWNHAVRYFRDTYDIGPLTADDYWAVIDQRGENDSTLGFAVDLRHLPQTDASLRRLIQALGSTTSEDFAYHYQQIAREMQLDVFVRNQAELLACPQLPPEVGSHLELRLKLLDESPANAWDRLMQFGLKVGGGYVGSFDSSQSHTLIEAAARGGVPICEQAMITLSDSEAANDWREIFAVSVLGMARHEPAVDALVEKLAIDADFLREETNRALARIASPRVSERLADFYPGKPWHVRLYASGSLPHIKQPTSVDALLKMLAVELPIENDPNFFQMGEGEPLSTSILTNLAELCSLAGLEESRRQIARYPEHADTLYLCECLLATAAMTGTALPEESEWRKLLEMRDARAAKRRALFEPLLKNIGNKKGRAALAALLGENAVDGNTPSFRTLASEKPIEPPLPMRVSPKVGRNDPCPCGSGKKYKKCCLK